MNPGSDVVDVAEQAAQGRQTGLKRSSRAGSFILMLTGALLVGAVSSGCAIVRGQQGAESYASDTSITGAVKAAFAKDPEVAATAISVETLRGTVQLSGFAKSETEKRRAGEIARDTEGVKRVNNSIIVRQGG